MEGITNNVAKGRGKFLQMGQFNPYPSKLISNALNGHSCIQALRDDFYLLNWMS
jgi:hypothetical protein